MKSIFYVLLLGVVGCAKPSLVKNNDLEKENLKGKVKSTYTEECTVKEKNGHLYFQGNILNKEINFYNAYGMNTYTCNAKPWDKKESKSEYTFDNQNRIKEQIDVFSNFTPVKMDFYYTKNCVSVLLKLDDDKLVRKTIQLFNRNRLVRTNFFLQNKKTKKFYLNSYTTFLYNRFKQDSVVTDYLFSKKKNEYVINQQNKYLYDQKTHNLVKHENYFLWYHHVDPANAYFKQRKIYTFKNYHYKYDKYRNWIEKIVQENGVLKGYKRKINYYA